MDIIGKVVSFEDDIEGLVNEDEIGMRV